MKIVLVHNAYQQPGGEDVVFGQECDLLRRAGHSVVTFQRSNWDVKQYVGIVQKAELAARTVWSSDTRAEFAKLLERERPDVVHVHNTFVMISPSIYSACRKFGVPVVQTLHNYRLFCPSATFFRNGEICEECVQHGVWRGVKHKCYRNSRSATAAVALMLLVHRERKTWQRDVTRYIALTEFARSRFLAAGLPAEKVCVKPNFVHPDPGPRRNLRGQYALFVGRLSPEKRVSTMLKAWAQLSDVPLVVIGGGPEKAQLQLEAASSSLGNVIFKGHMSRADTLEAMKSARFLVFSSEWYENFPVTIAESFACGVPVICSRLGAMAELVEDGKAGLQFIAGDSDDLARKVSWAWSHEDEMIAMGREARAIYEAKYTAEQNYPLLMEIYKQAIGVDRRLTEAETTKPVARVEAAEAPTSA